MCPQDVICDVTACRWRKLQLLCILRGSIYVVKNVNLRSLRRIQQHCVGAYGGKITIEQYHKNINNCGIEITIGK
jgi:hypothetical protein